MEVKKNWKVRAICMRCGREWTTRPKKNAEPPKRCHKTKDGQGCGLTNTDVIQVWKRETDAQGKENWVLKQDYTHKYPSYKENQRRNKP